ncbi:MAG: carboxypeptidase regulatory-like domain-containing protein, partial [Holophagales bacterium]|nr:carboxypeptidase regulatory-like domain-containing protein [Holophagales bacterium]
MTTSRLIQFVVAPGVLLAVACTPTETVPAARFPAPEGYITGVVQSAQGPEAGVWVIAETEDLPTKFVKIVVTDDDGRFMLPELPDAGYAVWVRGYGLVDSEPLEMRPTADPVTLQATNAATPEKAAKVYPGDYWLSLMAPPDESLFPGTGDDGNGMGTRMLSQAHWLDSLKSDCNFCHQLGSRQTRTVDHVFEAKPELTTHKEAWEWRLGTGVRGNQMYNVLRIQGMDASLDVYADWTERIAAAPAATLPPRPQGIERNLVLTLWDVG